MGPADRSRAGFPSGQFQLTSPLDKRGPRVMVQVPRPHEDRTMNSDPVANRSSGPVPPAPDWVEAIDVFEHHCIDFDRVVAQGVEVAIVRAGRGTRQDARWIEHVGAADRSGLSVGSYWYVYPSRAEAHHQAELWVAAIRGATVPFEYGHWADISTSDGLHRADLARFAASFLRRADEMLGDRVGVFSTPGFWRRHVGFDDPGRPRWWASEPVARERLDATSAGVRLSPSDRGGPGRHLVRPVPQVDRATPLPGLVVRGRAETIEQWQSRWERGSDIAVLQMHLNDLGARLVVDGVFGPQTDAAVRICDLLCRRDRLPWPFGLASDAPAGV